MEFRAAMQARANNYYPIINHRKMQVTGVALEKPSFQPVAVPAETDDGIYFTHVATHPPVTLTVSNDAGYRMKRLVDIVGSGIGLFFLGLVFPFIYLGIRLSTKGRVLFVQPRTGEDGKVFLCFKFRTMYVAETHPEAGCPDVTHKGDSRIFTFGRFLRKTNLDELPQLINVLRGEMSLVGPRPLPVEECRYWQRIIPGFSLRYCNTRPGLTGWAQITGYRGGNLDPLHMYYRLKRDLHYIENASMKLDLAIMWRTVRQMITRNTGAH